MASAGGPSATKLEEAGLLAADKPRSLPMLASAGACSLAADAPRELPKLEEVMLLASDEPRRREGRFTPGTKLHSLWSLVDACPRRPGV